MADRFAHAYLRGDPRVAAFVPTRYDQDVDRARVASLAAERSVRPELLTALRGLNEALAPSPARAAHLARLAEPGTTCVVTGQQVGLFLGPLYTVYKAAAAIVTARGLAAETGRPCVPIFWLQSEDHDFDEVATAHIPRTGEAPLALTARGASDSRVAMAHRRLEADVADLTDRLREALGPLPHATDTLEQLHRHYRPEAGWVEAFAGWLAELFAPEGLVLLNPRAPELAGLCATVHRRAVDEAAVIAERLLTRSAALAEAGFAAPVHVRAGAPLSFYHPDGPEGPRYRLAPGEGTAWSIVGADGDVTQDEVQTALRSDPLRFSTSALLRPLLQDTLLPTAAYVGGPGEIDYFAQLSPVYDAFGLPMPLLVPRARFAVVEPKLQRSLDELGLDVEALARPEAELLDAVARRPEHLPAPEALQEALLARVREELTRLSPALDALQPGLQKAADRTTESVERACSKFVDKYRGALNQADTRRADVVRKLRAALYPMESPQERVCSLPYYAARHGGRAFIERVVSGCRPYDPRLEVLVP